MLNSTMNGPMGKKKQSFCNLRTYNILIYDPFVNVATQNLY